MNNIFFLYIKVSARGMTWYLLGLLFFMVIRWVLATPYQSEIERSEDKHNWTSVSPVRLSWSGANKQWPLKH